MPNDTGSNYFLIPGGETPAPVTPPVPAEPVSPFEKYLIALENLQPAVELFPSSTQQPSTPAFTPMAAPAAVRVSPPATPTEPVSPFEKYLMDLENLQPPVEFKPGSYQETYTPAFTPMAAPAAVRVSPSKPDLSNPSTIDQPTDIDVGDGLITVDNKNKYLTENKMDLQEFKVRPTVTSPPEVIEPPEVVEPPVTPPPTVIVPEVKIPELVEPPKITFPIVTPPEKPVVPKPVVPTIPAIVPVTPTNRQPIVRPVVEPTTIPIATRKMIESLSPGYFKDINYDPDEILAAAMRSMGGRQARRSILNELQ
jgi:hypothetical protein